MNQNVKPSTAIAVVLVFAALLSLKFWADAKALENLGPDQLHKDRAGNLYIQFHDQLLKHDATGEFLKRINLDQFSLSGDIAFFNNADALLRIGKLQPSLWENIKTYRRQTNTTPLAAPDTVSGLFRCNLDKVECKRFGSGAIDFNRAFHLTIDPLNEDVYAADTSRHVLRKFDNAGNLLATRETGFRFPNQVLLNEAKLYVADTNHHQILAVDPHTQSFGNTLEAHSIYGGNPTLIYAAQLAGKAAQIWPTALLDAGDHWWVNIMRNGMNLGGIYIYDKQWHLLDKLPLPDDADPLDLIEVNNAVLINDLAGWRIFRFNKQGQRLADFHSPAFDRFVTDLQQQHDRYEMISLGALVIFIAGLGLGLILGLATAIQAQRALSQVTHGYDETEIPPSADEQAVKLDSPAIQWLHPRKGLRELAYLILGGVALMSTPAFTYPFTHACCGRLIPIVVLVLMILVSMALMVRAILTSRVGILDDKLILTDYRKRSAVGTGPRVVNFQNSHIIIDNCIVFLGKLPLPLYSRDAIKKQVLPRLSEARIMNAWQLQKFLFKQRHPAIIQFIVILILLIVLYAYAKLSG